MMRRVSIACVLCVLASACAEIREPASQSAFGVTDSPPGVSVYFDRDIQRLFDRSCTGGCHEPGGSGVAQAGLDLTAGAAYPELLDATRSRNGPQVVVNDPDNSILMWKVDGVDAAGRRVFGDVMPLGRLPLSAQELNLIRTWIAEGALYSTAPPRPPRILSAAALDERTIELIFDSDIQSSSAGDVTLYGVTANDGSGNPHVLSARREEADRVVLVLGTLLPGVVYTIDIVGLQGLNGLPIVESESAQTQYRPDIGFASQIQPIFDQSCAFVGCHAADDRFPPGEGLVLTAGRARQNLIDIPSVQRPETSRVLPGNADASYLIQKLSGTGIVGDRMPVGGPFLTSGETQVFRLWVEQGALDN